MTIIILHATDRSLLYATLLTKMMMNSTEVSAADLLLQDADFPDHYVNMQHPDDYKVVNEPFVEYTPHFSGHNNRLIVRICWLVPGRSNTDFIPMSFVCDTGAPMGLYLSTKALSILRNMGRIIEDETGNEYIEIQEIGKVSIEPTPPGHAPANIIGLRVIIKLGLNAGKEVKNLFAFSKAPIAW